MTGGTHHVMPADSRRAPVKPFIGTLLRDLLTTRWFLISLVTGLVLAGVVVFGTERDLQAVLLTVLPGLACGLLLYKLATAVAIRNGWLAASRRNRVVEGARSASIESGNRRTRKSRP
jgi:hypothetical protein